MHKQLSLSLFIILLMSSRLLAHNVHRLADAVPAITAASIGNEVDRYYPVARQDSGDHSPCEDGSGFVLCSINHEFDRLVCTNPLPPAADVDSDPKDSRSICADAITQAASDQTHVTVYIFYDVDDDCDDLRKRDMDNAATVGQNDASPASINPKPVNKGFNLLGGLCQAFTFGQSHKCDKFFEKRGSQLAPL
ncbi:hypothetical protein NHQ30_005182 [Ciborinia camelliae]|nr:hypothetical protein NHQ30_005182 [Ciborinia camelliae]